MLSLLIFVFAQHRSPKLNWNGPAVFVLRGKGNGHYYSIRFEQTNFKVRGRKVLWHGVRGNRMFAENTSYPSLRQRRTIKPFWGFDPSSEDPKQWTASEYLSKHTELVRVAVIVDNKKWFVPKWLYEDLTNASPGDESASISKDGKTLKVVQGGSDGAGSYTAYWTLHRNGRDSRKMEGAP